MSWTLEQAVTLLHDLQAHLRKHHVFYYVGLTGSVLYGETRSSAKDLDIIVYPQDSTYALENHLRHELQEFGLEQLHDSDTVKARWRRLGSNDNKHVEVWSWRGKRVDIFFLR